MDEKNHLSIACDESPAPVYLTQTLRINNPDTDTSESWDPWCFYLAIQSVLDISVFNIDISFYLYHSCHNLTAFWPLYLSTIIWDSQRSSTYCYVHFVSNLIAQYRIPSTHIQSTPHPATMCTERITVKRVSEIFFTRAIRAGLTFGHARAARSERNQDLGIKNWSHMCTLRTQTTLRHWILENHLVRHNWISTLPHQSVKNSLDGVI